MPKTPRIDNNVLLTIGREIMLQNGKPLTKLQSSGRSMLYALPNGETVRVRTCNDHILIVLADRPDDNAKLNIEGTNWLLIVMPEIERTPGRVIAYLVPTEIALEAVRRTHQEWLSTKPQTNGTNTTWNLWFDKNGPTKANDFGVKWSSYRLTGEGETVRPVSPDETSGRGNIKSEVEIARQRISKAAGVSPAAVRITIDFGA
jgi:hypothetical protein